MDLINNYRVLFLSSSSISSCFKLLGLLCTIEDELYLETIDIFCGVGLASIIILLYTLNYTIREIIGFFYKLSFCNNYISTDYKLDGSSVKKANLFQSEITRKISEILIEKYDVIPTLGSYYIKTGCFLIFPTYNNTLKKIEFINPREHSSCTLIECLSASIFNPYLENIFKLDNEYFMSCTIADKYPIYYLLNSKSNEEILGILCEVDTVSRNSFNIHSTKGTHYLIERHDIKELTDENIIKLISEGYSIDLKSNYKHLEFKSFNFPKYNFRNGS